MRNSSKSFAHQYGVSQKTMGSNPSGGLGLNPNLNIEDEYIENLLKQTHFLNMEIKLIKQKQKENKGMGIMGLLNKDQNPVVTHAVSSNLKYADMKNMLASKVNQAETNFLKLDDENYAVKAERDFIEKLSLKEEQKNIENKLYVDKEMGEGMEKLKDNEKKLQDIRMENSRIKEAYERLHRDWEELTSKQQTKALIKDITSHLEKETEDLKTRHFELKDKILQEKSNHLQKEDQKFKSDPKYVELLEENEKLQNDLKASEKELFDRSYAAKEMEELKKLSLRNKDVENELKKQAVEEAERLKKKLADKRAEFEGKLKDSKTALESNDEVRLLKGKIARKDKEISDLKKKTETSENNYKKLRDEVERLSKLLKENSGANKEREQQFVQLTAQKNDGAFSTNNLQLEFEKAEAEMSSTLNSLNDARKRLETLDEELTYLKAKDEYLTKEIDVDECMKGVKIEQLNGLMHNNSGLNDTIKDLMEKWEQMRKFSREPPSS